MKKYSFLRLEFVEVFSYFAKEKLSRAQLVGHVFLA